MSIKIRHGDVLSSKETFLIHQCNCVSKYAAGVAYSIFKKYPYSNIYEKRTYVDSPGETMIKGDIPTIEHDANINPKHRRLIANLLSQYYPGGSSKRFTHEGEIDTKEQRKLWFYMCLKNIAIFCDENPTLKRELAVPYGIGCGLAGGNWPEYYKILETFAKDYSFDIVIYKLI